jgi:hypothetical protein
MISIITGDIVNSRDFPSKFWTKVLKEILSTFGKSPNDWEIYRGDEFQIEVKNIEETISIALQIKAYLKSNGLDARMSIGVGDKSFKTKRISESNGSAFINSGELFDTLKTQKISLAINSGNLEFDSEMNLMLKMASTFMDSWLVQSAELVLVAIQNRRFSQDEIGVKLGINQAAVSRRKKRAQFDLVVDLDNHFRKKIKTISL